MIAYSNTVYDAAVLHKIMECLDVLEQTYRVTKHVEKHSEPTSFGVRIRTYWVIDVLGRDEQVTKERFIFYLNGKAYGIGPADYMRELFENYIEASDMYGSDEVEIKIVRRKKGRGGAKCLKVNALNTAYPLFFRRNSTYETKKGKYW